MRGRSWNHVVPEGYKHEDTAIEAERTNPHDSNDGAKQSDHELATTTIEHEGANYRLDRCVNYGTVEPCAESICHAASSTADRRTDTTASAPRSRQPDDHEPKLTYCPEDNQKVMHQ